MNIYTITFNKTTNWGANLQEYALFKFLKNNGYNVKVVNYQPDFMIQKHIPIKKVKNANGILEKIKSILLLPTYYHREYKFDKFRKSNIEYTKIIHTKEELENLNQPDIYICGSDQIWNTNFVGNDQVYFLNFKTLSKKISYAASAGKDYIDTKEIDDIIDRISSINYLSVREKYLYNLLNKKKVKPLFHVLDPVFLLTKKEYHEIASQKNKYKNYVLIYELAIDKKNYQMSRKIADEYGLQIIQINCIKKRYPVDKIIANPSPEEFLELFINANFVITNSFHGTAFSIILQKQFYSMQLDLYNSRISSLLEELDLKDRLISEFNENLDIKLIDYETHKKIIETKIEFSRNILLDGIKHV